MRTVEVDRPCPVCGVWGWYSEMAVYRGAGRGVPGMQWLMKSCGHVFFSPPYSRLGVGWVKVDPADRDAQPCE